MWLIMGTSPQVPEGECIFGPYGVEGSTVLGPQGQKMRIERGVETLATAASLVCAHMGKEAPYILCGGDKGKGDGSRAVYAFMAEHLHKWQVQGITFHYLFPDVDWHNRVLMAVDGYADSKEGRERPTLVADAGFMYVAKMSGYADAYDLFTPDVGEMAFLADELAPHPFYTRGFLLDRPEGVEDLLARALEHGNVAKNLIIKGHVDHIVEHGQIVGTVNVPSVPSMEAIGGTGDLVTGMATGLLASGLSMTQACRVAVKANRVLAELAQPTPATQVHQLTPYICEAVEKVLQEQT